MAISQAERVEQIKRRARELWEAEGLAPDREQACWDKAVEEFEGGRIPAGRKQPGSDATEDTDLPTS